MKRIVFLAVVALVAFAGVAYAAGSITGDSIKNGSITGKDIKAKSLTPKHFKGSVHGQRGPVGETGSRGAQGPAGPAGPQGPSAISGITVATGGVTIAPGDIDGGTIFCPAGQRVVSGGYFSSSADGEVFTSVANDDRTGWIIALDNFDSPVSAELDGEAYCAATGRAVAAGRPRVQSRAKSRAKLERLIARRRAAH
ncbi:MAG: hypothetical protein ACRDK0_02105 [Solirubrobacteraceae bacterium]